MSKTQRIRQVILAAGVLLFAMVLLVMGEKAIPVIAIITGISLTLSGLKDLVYYRRMARFMVDGKLVLFKGIILFDVGLLTLTLTDIPTLYLIIYILTGHLFAGAIDIIRSRESKQLDASIWKFKMAQGITNILIFAVGLIFLHNEELIVYVYAGGIIYSSCLRIAGAFRKTAIVYIQ